MKAYVYRAALLCEECGADARHRLTVAGKAPADPADEYSYDSDRFPKGPFSDGGGEADGPQHCDDCARFLENPLTSDGYAYVREIVTRDTELGSTSTIALSQWAPFYGIDPITCDCCGKVPNEQVLTDGHLYCEPCYHGQRLLDQ